ncbi:hypothetical protein VTH82DRAFT_1860 [Thermothelomyces myriococcoides]
MARSNWPGSYFQPKSVKRVGEIFDNPKFYVEGPTANDVRQGHNGDCWLMAALCTLSNKPGLIERVCVARDEEVGVYGFVFNRDGEWFSEIIDDHLYLIKPDYDEARMGWSRNRERALWEDLDNRADSEEKYRRAFQSNSEALYFAQCENENETWLPLLEKAYAKAHGDYAAIEGGHTGEGIEDLTGGVTTEIFTSDILDKERFWSELLRVNQDFLFGCSTGLWGLGFGERRGIQEGHAYSIMRAVEIDGERLLLLKNPWGKVEWTGPWSDGSKEWTPEWLQKLNHRFGDDGVFWISYKDLLRKFQRFDRTRLFSPEWTVTSVWTTLNVSWAPEYHHTKFSFTLAKPGSVVVVLSQLDDRYFRGLEGEYIFGLAFRIHKAGEDEYLVRSRTTYGMNRSCSVELDLEAGEYTVLVRIDAERFEGILPAEDVVRLNAKNRREKLLRIGLAYDLAHSKAKVVETAEEKAAREAYIKWKQEKRRAEIRKHVNKSRQKHTYYERKQWAQKRKDAAWARKVERKRNEKRKAKREAKEAKRKAAEEAEKTSPAPAETKEEASSGDAQAEVKKEGSDQVTSEAAQTPSFSTPEKTSSSEPADTERKSGDAEATDAAQESTSAGASSSEQAQSATKPEDSQTKTEEEAPEGEEGSGWEEASQDEEAPKGKETTSQAAVSGPEARFKERIRTALKVVSNFKRELKSMVDRLSDNDPSETDSSEIKGHDSDDGNDDDDNAPRGPPIRHRFPPPRPFPRPPVSDRSDGNDDEEDDDDDDDSSSTISFDTCSIRSVSSVSDTELDHIVEREAARRHGPPDGDAASRVGHGPGDEPDGPEGDAWNAVAVVGLRVYFKAGDADGQETVATTTEDGEDLVKIKIVRPNLWEIEKEKEIKAEKEDKGEKEEETEQKEHTDVAEVLDVDDSAKDAVTKAV